MRSCEELKVIYRPLTLRQMQRVKKKGRVEGPVPAGGADVSAGAAQSGAPNSTPASGELFKSNRFCDLYGELDCGGTIAARQKN